MKAVGPFPVREMTASFVFHVFLTFLYEGHILFPLLLVSKNLENRIYILNPFLALYYVFSNKMLNKLMNDQIISKVFLTF